MRLIVRKERPHPGAQLRFTDARRHAAHLLRHQHHRRPDRRPRTASPAAGPREDRIRDARDTGLRNLPLHDTAQNQIWLEIVQLALDLLAWMPMLALTGTSPPLGTQKLRLRLFSAAAQLVTTGRRRILRLARHWPWTDVITSAIDRLQALPNPG